MTNNQALTRIAVRIITKLAEVIWDNVPTATFEVNSDRQVVAVVNGKNIPLDIDYAELIAVAHNSHRYWRLADKIVAAYNDTVVDVFSDEADAAEEDGELADSINEQMENWNITSADTADLIEWATMNFFDINQLKRGIAYAEFTPFLLTAAYNLLKNDPRDFSDICDQTQGEEVATN